MVTYNKFIEELVNQGFDRTIVERLIEEYRVVKREHLLSDYEKAILHSAKVSDLILALIKNKVTGANVDIDNIYFNKFLDEILKYPKQSAEDVILTLAIPRVSETIYTIRSKKNVAHVKTIDPNFIDSSYCVSACNWMLSELVLLFLKVDVNEAKELIDSILTKKAPTVEEFEDGSIVILRKGLSISKEISLALYHYYPKRLSNQDLIELLKVVTSSNIYTNLYHLENERLIHRTSDGSKLTKLGIKYVEDEVLAK